MNSSVAIRTSTLSDLVNLLLPAPDDPRGDWGPAGPVVRPWGRRWGPSPDPWRWGPQPDPWRSGPQPEPWRLAGAVRAVLDSMVARIEQAGIIVIGGEPERLAELARAQVQVLVDEFCGTPPRRKPFPGPWGPVLDSDQLDPRWLLLVGAQLELAARGLADDHPLAPALSAGAETIFATALARLEG